jgi:Zn-dependent protease
MFETGYFEIGKVRGVPLRLHWTLPVGMLLLGGLSPLVWLAFTALVLAHEAGHALLVRRYRLHVLSIDLTGFGGATRWAGHATEHQKSVIAWGGVAAQAVLLVAALAAFVVAGPPTSSMGHALSSVFIRSNLFIIALNLLPMAPFDGADAWKLPARFIERLRGGGGPPPAPSNRVDTRPWR